MRLFLIPILRLNNFSYHLFFIILLFSCKSPKIEDVSLPQPQPFLKQAGQSLIYNATFDYKDFRASGILVIKKLEVEGYHIVLISKFGVTLMEFKLNDQGITWIKKFEQLEKRSVEKLIAKDFRMLLLMDLFPPFEKKLLEEHDLFVTYKIKNDLSLNVSVNKSEEHVTAIRERGISPVKTSVSYVYQGKDVPEQALIEHSNVKLTIQLNLLERNYAEE